MNDLLNYKKNMNDGKAKKLPDVIFVSQKASELLKTQLTDYYDCIEYDRKGINNKDWSWSKQNVDMSSRYRNISLLLLPAEKKKKKIRKIICRCRNGLCFVYQHYSDDDDDWRIFVRCNDVECYCYIQDVRP